MSSALFDVPGPRARIRHRLYGVLTAIGTAAVVALIVQQLYAKEQITGDAWEPFQDTEILAGVLQAFGITLFTAALAIVLSIGFGAIFAAGRLSDHAVIRWPCVVIIEFFRAVPLVLMILALFIGFGEVTDRLGALVIALILYNGSVLAETFRAGINAVPRGQSEAAYAIGMRKTQVMTRILTPQAVRIMLPAIISQCVVALKDTALGFVLGAPEAVSVGKLIYVSYGNPIATGIVLAICFIIINYGLTKLAQYLEARQRRRGRAVLAEAATTVAGGPGSGAND